MGSDHIGVGIVDHREDRVQQKDIDRIEVGVVNIRVGNSEWALTVLKWALLAIVRTEGSKWTLTVMKWGLLTLE